MLRVDQLSESDARWTFDRDVTFGDENCPQLQLQRTSDSTLQQPIGVTQTGPRVLEAIYDFGIKLNGLWAIGSQPQGFTPADAVDWPQSGIVQT